MLFVSSTIAVCLGRAILPATVAARVNRLKVGEALKRRWAIHPNAFGTRQRYGARLAGYYPLHFLFKFRFLVPWLPFNIVTRRRLSNPPLLRARDRRTLAWGCTAPHPLPFWACRSTTSTWPVLWNELSKWRHRENLTMW